MGLTSEQTKRYARQLILEEMGTAGQEKLSQASVLIIGAGGLGSPAALYLAAAGVGNIGLVDADTVELSNLQRQILHTTNDLGRAKVVSARETLSAVNPETAVTVYRQFADSENIEKLVETYDFILDATDNFASKFMINDACVRAKKPFSHAGIAGFGGQLMTYVPGEGPCYRCVFENPPPKDTKKNGAIGAVCGVIGSLQAMEAIKCVLGIGDLLVGKLLTYDGLKAEFRTIHLPRRAGGCAVCGELANGRTGNG